MAVVSEVIKENIVASAANTYTEKELTFMANEIGKTKKNSSDIKVMLVHGINLEIVSGFDAAGVTDADDLMIQFCTNSEDAEVTMEDKDVFFKKKWRRDFITGGHLNDKDLTPRFTFNPPLPYFKPRIWVAVDSTGLAAAADIDFEIVHTYGYVSKEVYNRVIARKI
jgi:hypothetical protein